MPRLNSTRPSGDGDVVAARDLIDRAGLVGQRIRLNPGGGEYEAALLAAELQVSPHGWVRLRHQRAGMEPTINVVPPSVEVRILD